MKVSGTYPSLSRGVSQQAPDVRIEGQHGEQVNMWTDPVHGLSRRRGTEWEFSIGVNGVQSIWDSPQEERAALQEWATSYVTVPWKTSQGDFQITFPRAPLPTIPQAVERAPHTCIVTECLEEQRPLVPGVRHVRLHMEGADGPAVITALAKGVAAWAQVGDYFLLAPKDTPFPRPPETDRLKDTSNLAHGVVQVVSGVPNVEYTLRVTVSDGSTTETYTGTYTTPSSAYGGALDTSGIEILDGSGNVREDYTKDINDATNDYNTAATQWITEAAQKTLPGYIADQLATSLTSSKGIGSLGGSLIIGGHGATLQLEGQNGVVISTIEVTDRSSGTLMKALHHIVKSEADLTTGAVVGHVIQVQPQDGGPSYYLEAVDPSESVAYGNWLAKARWIETSRTSSTAATPPWVIVRIADDRTKAYAATTVAALRNVAYPDVVDLPDFGSRAVGDEETSPTPYFLGRQITAMGMFQDRLFVCADGVATFSEIGNYFNFYRTSVLTVSDADPVELFASGGQSDTLRASVIFDRSLILFGDLYQYSLDGTVPLTASTGTMTQSGSIEDATDAPPVVGGSLVFFGKRRESSTEVFQIAIGQVQDTTNFSGLGLQLHEYLRGAPAELLHISSPQMVLVRTTGNKRGLYVFRYIDQEGQRLLDSWSRLEYSQAFGQILSMFYHNDAVHLIVWREAQKTEGRVWSSLGHENPQYERSFGWVSYEKQSLLPQVGDLPYLDSMRRWSSFSQGTGNPHTAFAASQAPETHPALRLAFAKAPWASTPPPSASQVEHASYPLWLWGYDTPPRSQEALQGAVQAEHDPEWVPASLDHAVVGLDFLAEVELTSPARLDRDGHPVRGGRLTINSLRVQYRETAGVTFRTHVTYSVHQATIANPWETPSLSEEEVSEYSARILLDDPTILATVPVSTGEVTEIIGRRNTEYTCSIESQGWLPLNIVGVSWVGQWFMNHQHV